MWCGLQANHVRNDCVEVEFAEIKVNLYCVCGAQTDARFIYENIIAVSVCGFGGAIDWPSDSDRFMIAA